MYTFTLHFEYHSSANNDSLPEQTKEFEAIDERQATAMAHLEIQTMAPLSKIVGSKIVLYRPRMIKLALPSDYPPVVAALAKEIEVDPVVEELKKQARQIYLEKHGFLPGEKPEEKKPAFSTGISAGHKYRHTGVLYVGYLEMKRFSIGYKEQPIHPFVIETDEPLSVYLRTRQGMLLHKIARSLDMTNFELFEEIVELCDANGMVDAAQEFTEAFSFTDFLTDIPVTDASQETIQDFLEDVLDSGIPLPIFRFFLHNLESERIEFPEQKAN